MNVRFDAARHESCTKTAVSEVRGFERAAPLPFCQPSHVVGSTKPKFPREPSVLAMQFSGGAAS